MQLTLSDPTPPKKPQQDPPEAIVNDIRLSAKTRQINGLIASEGSLLLGLSLFIILLAFFIVMNGLSTYSKTKVGQAIESLETAFAQSIIPTDMERSAMDEQSQRSEGQGDAVEALQGVLKSLLPNLNMQTNPNSNGGSVMAIRMEKDQFERLAGNLIPLFVRILNEKNKDFSYGLTLTSHVRDPFARGAFKSFGVLNDYINQLVEAGLPQHRINLNLDTGNPAIIMFTFESLPKEKT